MDVVLRVARADDALVLWHARSQLPRTAFVGDAQVTLDSHTDWFRAALLDANRTLLIGEVDHRPVGYVRGDHNNDEIWVSIALLPEARGKGLGVELLKLFVARAHPGSKLRAHVHPTNVASQSVFGRAGFGPTGTAGEFELWSLDTI